MGGSVVTEQHFSFLTSTGELGGGGSGMESTSTYGTSLTSSMARWDGFSITALNVGCMHPTGNLEIT